MSYGNDFAQLIGFLGSVESYMLKGNGLLITPGSNEECHKV